MKMTEAEDESPAVEMSAMIDIVFLLLIFFLVAATIRKKHMELPITLPAGQSAMVVKAPDETLVVSIFKQGDETKFALSTVGEQIKTTGGSREIMTIQQLRLELKKKADENRNRKVRIDADTGVEFGKIAQVLDHLQVYQLKQVGFRTRDRKGK